MNRKCVLHNDGVEYDVFLVIL